MAIRNPVEWSVDHWRNWSHAVAAGGRAAARSDTRTPPSVRRIGVADLRDALARGLADFGAYRTDVIFIAIIYPVAGLVLAQALSERNLLQLLFPLVSGFALIGPFAAIGLYEMSRRREEGVTVGWRDAFGVLVSPSFGAILALGLVLLGIFLLWMIAAQAIYALTLGPEPPASFGAFVEVVFTTTSGWTMIAVGIGVGFLFAVLALAIGVVSFPLMLDRKVSVGAAVRTSLRAVARNPGPMALWGLIVVVALVLGAVPLLVGLAVVMPVLGHATWHLYRKVVAHDGPPPA